MNIKDSFEQLDRMASANPMCADCPMLGYLALSMGMLNDAEKLTADTARFVVRKSYDLQGSCHAGPVNGECGSQTATVSMSFRTVLRRGAEARMNQILSDLIE